MQTSKVHLCNGNIALTWNVSKFQLLHKCFSHIFPQRDRIRNQESCRRTKITQKTPRAWRIAKFKWAEHMTRITYVYWGRRSSIERPSTRWNDDLVGCRNPMDARSTKPVEVGVLEDGLCPTMWGFQLNWRWWRIPLCKFMIGFHHLKRSTKCFIQVWNAPLWRTRI